MATEPLSGTVLWTDPASGADWAVTISWHEQGGVPTPVGIRLSSWRSSQPATIPLPAYDEKAELPRVDGTLLRRLPIAQLVQESRSAVVGALRDIADSNRRSAERIAGLPDEIRSQLPAELFDTALMHSLSDSIGKWASEMSAPKRGGRDLGDEHYAEVALIYRQAVVKGLHPTKAVEQHYQVAKSSAAKKVARARERGFLPKNPGKGRIGRLTQGGEQS